MCSSKQFNMTVYFKEGLIRSILKLLLSTNLSKDQVIFRKVKLILGPTGRAVLAI